MPTETYAYTSYGLEIQSALPLPELIEAPAGSIPDVSIQFGDIPATFTERLNGEQAAIAEGDDAVLFWADIGTFWVRSGRKIIISPAPTVPESALRLFILGSALGVLLHQRGYLALHASAVDIGGQVVAFVGQKGFGKSTTAAAFHAEGFPLVTDDVVAIRLNGRSATVVPGYPQLKLWPESAAFIGHNPDTLPRLIPEPGFEKRFHRVSDTFTEQSLPLAHIFLLSESDAPAIIPITAQEAFFALMEHWQIVRLGESFARAIGGAHFFFQCTQLMDTISVSELARPFDLHALPQTLQMVVEHITARKTT